jgi:prepilin-type N-terminal cleavage/methylation domain-containing protein
MKTDLRQPQAGFTLVELVVTSTLLGALVYAVSTLALNGGEAQEYARRLNRATEITQDLVDRVRTEMISSVRLFGNDAEGAANLAVLDLTGAPTPLTGLRLPTISPSESIRADTAGAEITGNSLFFARLAWLDRFTCVSGNTYMVDVHRWTYYYLTPEDGGPAAGNPIGLNIVSIDSEPLVDGAAIDRITNVTDQEEVLLHLAAATPDDDGVAHEACQVVWLRGQLPAVSGTFRQIDDTDGSLSLTPIAPRTAPWRVLRADVNASGLLSYRHHSIATNFARPSFGVGKFSVMSTAGAGFPHGFEVQTVGPSGGRQTMLHVVVASTNRRGQWAWSDMQVVIDSRDL